ncbi:hypothetical protein MRB53_033269 [Persea americana]|uniref:Uncharacterized protein n=1 Tax=Persea americana TaxID=3435 RepID=A0ACC2KU78_PERAE|nr:hypothetical protein MRB53_033269 [Persea americana]
MSSCESHWYRKWGGSSVSFALDMDEERETMGGLTQWAVWFVWQSEGFIPKRQIPCHLSTDLRSRGHDLADATSPSLLLTFRDGALHRVDRHLFLLAGVGPHMGFFPSI